MCVCVKQILGKHKLYITKKKKKNLCPQRLGCNEKSFDVTSETKNKQTSCDSNLSTIIEYNVYVFINKKCI